MDTRDAMKKAMNLFSQLAEVKRKELEIKKESQEIYDKLEHLKNRYLEESK